METETLITAPKAVRLAVARALLDHCELMAAAKIHQPDKRGAADRDNDDTEDRHAAFRSRDGQTGSWQARTSFEARQPQAVQCVTSRTGASKYTGSETVWMANRVPFMLITAEAAPATRAGSIVGRLSTIYAARFCSVGNAWLAMKARIFASVSGQTRRPPRMSRTKCGSFIANLPNVIGDMPCEATNWSIASSSGGASFCIFSNVS